MTNILHNRIFNSDKLHSKLFAIKYIIIIVLLGLVVLTWCDDDQIIYTPGIMLGVNPWRELYEAMYAWKDYYSLGASLPSFAVLPIKALYVAFASLFGISLAQKLIYYLLFTLSGISMYILLTMLGNPEVQIDEIAKVIASIFYMMSPFALSVIWWNPCQWTLTYAIFPLFMSMFINIVIGGFTFRKLIIIIVISILFAPAFNLPYVPAYSLAIILFMIWYSLSNLNKDAKKQIMKRFMSLILLLPLVHAWWLLPTMTNITSWYSVANPSSSESALLYASKFSTILNTIRLMGYPASYTRYHGEYVTNWSTLFNSPLFKSITIIIPLASFASLLVKQNFSYKEKKILMYFSLLAIITIFLMKGVAPPFGFINLLFIKLPFGAVFRHPYDKFGFLLPLSYSALIAFLITYIRRKLKHYKSRINKSSALGYIIIFGLLICIITQGYPFITGDVISSGGRYVSSYKVVIPKYYWKAKRFLKSLNYEPRVISLPDLVSDGNVAYKWKEGIQTNENPFEQRFFEVDVIDFPNGNPHNDLILRELSCLFKNRRYLELQYVLGFLGVNFILLHNDWNEEFPNPINMNPKELTGLLLKLKAFDHVTKIGQLTLYHVNSSLPMVYISTNPIYIIMDSKIDALEAIAMTAKVLNLTPNKKPIFLMDYHNNFYHNGINSSIVHIVRVSNMKGYANIRYYGKWYLAIYGYIEFPIKLKVNLKLSNGSEKSFNVIMRNFTKYAVLDFPSDTVPVNATFYVIPQSLNMTPNLNTEEAWVIADNGIIFKGGKPSVLLLSDNNLSNFTLKLKVKVLESNRSWPGIIFGMKDNKNYYVVQVPIDSERKGTLELYQVKNGKWFFLTRVSLPLTSNEFNITLITFGDKIKVFINNKQYLPQTGEWLELGSIKGKVGLRGVGAKTLFHIFSVHKTCLAKALLLIKKNTWGIVKLNSMRIRYHKLSPVEYEVHISNVNLPFYLVLMQSYDKLWNLEVHGGKVANHLLANIFANAWYIKPISSNITVKIYFSGQKYFTYGVIITVIGVVNAIALIYFGSRLLSRNTSIR